MILGTAKKSLGMSVMGQSKNINPQTINFTGKIVKEALLLPLGGGAGGVAVRVGGRLAIKGAQIALRSQVVPLSVRKVGRNLTTLSRISKPINTAVKIIGSKSQPSLYKPAISLGMTTAFLGGSFELLHQLNSDEPIDWQRVGGMTLLSGTSGYAGAMTGTIVKNALVSNQTRLFSNLIASQTNSTMLLGGLAGGMVATGVFSYGAYLLGYGSLESANRSMITSSTFSTLMLLSNAAFWTSSLSALGATTTTGSLWVSALGAFGISTPISSLSGVAATNATLAWLGGSFGAAGGAAVLTGIGALAFAAGAGISYLYYLKDEKEEQQRIEFLLTAVQKNLAHTKSIK